MINLLAIILIIFALIGAVCMFIDRNLSTWAIIAEWAVLMIIIIFIAGGKA